MNKALALIEDCLNKKYPELNLAGCGLNDESLSITGEVGQQLAKCTHLTKLVLSNHLYKWSPDRSSGISTNPEYAYKIRDVYPFQSSEMKGQSSIHFLREPEFRDFIPSIGLEVDNLISTIPDVISELTNLEEFICGGSTDNNWEICSLVQLRGLEKLKTLVLNNNNISVVDCLHWFPNLKKLDLRNNKIKHLLRIGSHKGLRALDLSGNKLQYVHDIGKFPYLEWLNISNNELRSMAGLNNLGLLRFLDLSNNNIDTYLPFKRLILLKTLNISNNRFRALEHPGELENLENLLARCNKINSINGVMDLKHLKVLDLSHNMIDQLPVGVHLLENLELLDLSNNSLQQLDAIDDLTKLKILNVAYNLINDIPYSCLPSCLEVLILNNNRLSILPVLPCFTRLKELYAAENDIETVMEGAYSYLSTLVIHNNKINNLHFLRNCKELSYLDISYNRLLALGPIGDTPKLRFLFAEHNEISGILVLNHYTHLHQVDLSNNQIREVAGIENLLQLQRIFLHFNAIREIGIWRNLPSLISIDLQNNTIRNLNNRLIRLDNLKELNASSNRISQIPDVSMLRGLTKLILSNNRIKKLSAIHHNSNLEEIHLDQNVITALTDTSMLFEFKLLNLSYNAISQVREFLKLLKDRKEIIILAKDDRTLQFCLGDKTLALNAPYFDLPAEIRPNDTQSIRNWFIARDQGGFINLEVRCILFGNGETGKTALSHYLRTGEFYAVNNRTHGILIESWEVERENWSEEFIEAIVQVVYLNDIDVKNVDISKVFTCNIWDFGGQEFYHATHRLFMSSDVLYLVLWENESDFQDENKGIFPKEYWVNNIEHYAPLGSILLVQNRADKSFHVEEGSCYKIGTYDENNEARVSQFKLDIEILKAAILKRICSLPHFAGYIPKVYHRIKTFIQHVNRHYITFFEYEAVCKHVDDTAEKIMMEPSQRESLIKYLDNIGSVVCFRHRDNIHDAILKDYIFTNPRWLTKVIYQILERGLDEFDLAHVEEIVSQYKLSAEVWISVMRNFGLIFRIRSDEGDRFIAPQYLPYKCKNQKALTFALVCKKMSCSFTISYPKFMPGSNFLRLISHYGSEHVNHLYWKNGLVFLKNETTVFIECINKIDERKIKVNVQDNGKEMVAEILSVINEIDQNEHLQISIDEVNYVSLSLLKKKIQGNKLEIDATNGETLSISDFKFLFKEQSTAVFKKTIRVFVAFAREDRKLQQLLIKQLKPHLLNRPAFIFELWTEDDIDLAGGDINDHISKSDVAILLVSAYLTSTFKPVEEFRTSLQWMKECGLLMLPVLARSYDSTSIKELADLPFFEVLFRDYGFVSPFLRNEMMPFDVIAENDRIEDLHLYNYHKNLADMLCKLVSERFSRNA